MVPSCLMFAVSELMKRNSERGATFNKPMAKPVFADAVTRLWGRLSRSRLDVLEGLALALDSTSPGSRPSQNPRLRP
eukprot:1827236-Alexandrium_andersonii.AAC.1